MVGVKEMGDGGVREGRGCEGREGGMVWGRQGVTEGGMGGGGVREEGI